MLDGLRVKTVFENISFEMIAAGIKGLDQVNTVVKNKNLLFFISNIHVGGFFSNIQHLEKQIQ